jgi:hypothetical protein
MKKLNFLDLASALLKYKQVLKAYPNTLRD